MSKARIKAFTVVEQRLERTDKRLRETLAGQCLQQEQEQARIDERLSEIAQADRTLGAHAARIDALVGGRRPVRIDELLGWQEQLSQAEAQRDALEAALGQMREALSRIEGAMAYTRTEIMRNEARLHLCRERLAALCAELERAAEDAQDEEAEEAIVSRRLAQRARQRQQDSGGRAR